MNRTQQAIRDLNDLVSVRDQLTAEEWLEQVYPVAVSAQHKTASGKTVEFLPEIWGLIKDFAISRTKEQLANSIISVVRSVDTKFALGDEGYMAIYQNGVALTPYTEPKVPAGTVLYRALTGQIFRIERGAFCPYNIVWGKSIIKEKLAIKEGRKFVRIERCDLAEAITWGKNQLARRDYKNGKDSLGRVAVFYKIDETQPYTVKSYLEADRFTYDD